MDDENEASAVADAEAGRIGNLEASLGSPDQQGMDDVRCWRRQAVMNELLGLRAMKIRRGIEENWLALERLVGQPISR